MRLGNESPFRLFYWVDVDRGLGGNFSSCLRLNRLNMLEVRYLHKIHMYFSLTSPVRLSLHACTRMCLAKTTDISIFFSALKP